MRVVRQFHKVGVMILVFLLVGTGMPIDQVSALSEGDFIYVEKGDGTAEITDYKGDATDVVIPEKLKGLSVTTIGYDAFNGKELTSVTIPESVSFIDSYAFKDNQLTSVNIPNSVTTIGNGAFVSNELTSVTIPNSVSRIGSDTFKGNQLTSVDIPNGVTTIGNGAFASNKLTSVKIPYGVILIDPYTFKDNELTSVDIPNSVSGIGTEAFACNKLTSVEIPYVVRDIGTKAFAYNQLTSVTIKNKDTKFGENIFFENTKNLEIIGYDPSTAKDYASKWGYTFINHGGGVSFLPNGSFDWKKPHSIGLEVSGYDETKQLQYTWSANQVTPTETWLDLDLADQPIITPSESGEYYLHVSGTNLFGDPFTKSSEAFRLDNTAPIIHFSNDGNKARQREVSTEVTVDDAHSGVDENSLYYIWTDENVAPQFDSDWEPFTNKDEIILKNKTGAWYLHVYAKDLAGNEIILSTNPFRLYVPSSGGTPPSQSDDATLEELDIHFGGDSLIDFDPDQTEYSLEIEADELTLNAGASDSGATMRVNGEVIEGEVTLPLIEGENVFEIVVTAEDGTTKTYTLIINRLKKVPFEDIKEHWAGDYIKTAYRNGWFYGYPNGSFGPDKPLSRMQSASLFVRILGLTATSDIPFTDITSVESETVAELEKAFANGVVNGFPDGTFKPYRDVTRAQFALMIYRTYEQVTGMAYTVEQPANFSDITGYNEETQKAIAMLVELGIAEGDNGEFKPDNQAKRAHAAKMLVNFKEVLDRLKENS